MAITIKDVAKEAGVSPSTVSRVLSNSAGVSEEKKERVIGVVQRLNYRPNSLGRGLRTNRTYTFGLVIPDITNPFFPEITKGVDDAAHKHGYNIFLCNTEGNAERELDYVNLLCERKVDGIILDPTWEEQSRGNLKVILEREIPVVVIDREVGSAPVDTVLIGNIEGAYRATKHLISLGHRKIGIITGPLGFTISINRLEGYQRALKEEGIELNPELVKEAKFSFESGYRAAKQLVAMSDPPTAIFACSDVTAFGAMVAIEESGLSVPKDISLVGFDNVQIASLVRPQLTTVAQPFYKMGQVAVKLLLRRVSKSSSTPFKPKRVVLPTELICRFSTKAISE